MLPFKDLYDIIMPYTMIGPKRLKSLYDLALLSPKGNFVECGACLGGSSALLAHIAKHKNRKVFSFDTFDGIPAPTVEDGNESDHPGITKGSFSYASIDSLIQVCKKVKGDKVITPVKGLFENKLKDTDPGEIALLHMDGDWYKSTMDILINYYNKVVKGGFIQVDDYSSLQGCRLALHDFERSNNLYFDLHKVEDVNEYAVWFRRK